MNDLNQLSTTFDGLLKLSPPVLLAVVINFILLFTGRLPYFKNSKDNREYLPVIALILGAILYPFVAEVGKINYSIPNPTIFNIVIGMCIGGLAVVLHKTFKLTMKKLFGVESGDTVIIKKDDVV